MAAATRQPITQTLAIASGELDPSLEGYSRLRDKVLGEARNGGVRVDLSAAGPLHEVELAVIVRLEEDARERALNLEVVGLSDPIKKALAAASTALASEEMLAEQTEPLLERVGEETLRAAADVVSWGEFIREVLNAIFIDPFVGRPWKWSAVVEQMDLIGVRGTGIIIFISILTGTVLALNGARELAQFGATIYIANLVGVSMAREMGPLITAVIVAGRSGSAIAAELGTMVVNEEIDAMNTMALPPSRFLIAPRIIALVVMLPCLSIVSDFFGIAGGYMVGVGGMGLGSANYLRQTEQTLFADDILSGLIKAAVFAFLMGVISCYEGMRVSGGARGVGTATTRAVVSSVIAAIVADAVFTLIFYLTD